MAKEITVNESVAGQRTDKYVTSLYPSISRAYIHKLFESGKVLLDDAPAKPGYKLRQSDHLRIDFEPDELEQIPEIDLPIIYEDEHVLVINKPVGVISHSRGKHWNEPSVASFVRQKTGQPGDRAGIVHRLDRATSGVMICAKNGTAMSFLQKQFSNRNVKKLYIAVTAGRLDPESAIIDMPIERNPKTPSTFRVGPNGKASVTEYKVIESTDTCQLVQLKPTTGRTHQLRVHLKQVGHPIIGDTLYGIVSAERLYLHAQSLEITLPNGERRTFEADLPKEFKSLLAAG